MVALGFAEGASEAGELIRQVVAGEASAVFRSLKFEV